MIEEFYYKGNFINNKQPDNVVFLKNNKYMKIKKIYTIKKKPIYNLKSKDIKIEGTILIPESLFDYPVDSISVGFAKIVDSEFIESYDVSYVQRKCYYCTYDNNQYAVKMLHDR